MNLGGTSAKSIPQRNLRLRRIHRKPLLRLIIAHTNAEQLLPTDHRIQQRQISIMSDNGEVEVENPVSSWPVLPSEVTKEIGSIKLFNKWTYDDVECKDISLQDYVQLRSASAPRNPTGIPS